MPSCFSGRSRTWPTVARTRYARPRYLPMVFAFAGDSTITSEVLPGSDGPSSSYVNGARPRPFAAPLAAARPGDFAAVLAADFFAVDFLREVAMWSVHRRLLGTAVLAAETRAFRERADVLERDAPVDLAEG